MVGSPLEGEAAHMPLLLWCGPSSRDRSGSFGSRRSLEAQAVPGPSVPVLASLLWILGCSSLS